MSILAAALASLGPRQWVTTFFVFAAVIVSQNPLNGPPAASRAWAR